VAGQLAGLILMLPAAAGAQAPTGDSVTGSARDCFEPGDLCLGFADVNPDARSGPAGQEPTGTVFWTVRSSPGVTQTTSATVTCLSVRGGAAVIGVTGTTQVLGGIELPTAGLIGVTDRGGPDSGQDTFEFAVTTGDVLDPPLPGPTDCSSFLPGAQVFVNEFGDLVVTDAQPSPTSKDQCKNGGWRNFGDTFKNQGQCVAFVERGPKP
jgi:hypothetical protein